MKRHHWPYLAYNWISALGAITALVAGISVIILLVFSYISGPSHPYLGVLLYLLLPAVLVMGLVLIPIGMYHKWRSLMKSGEQPYHRWPSVDLNNKRNRNAFMVFVLGSITFVMVSTVGIYEAYQFTDSVVFCGKTCHQVMLPYYTTYHESPHARVKCVDCHIGPGAGWYARAKLSGLYQVYATIAKKYPSPIPIPITSLRPLQEECYQCHWPNKFFGSLQKTFEHYMYDKENTHWPVDMLVKVGGGSPETPPAAGIHWHMNISVKVEYIALDRQRQEIPWVRVTYKRTGRTRIYRDVTASGTDIDPEKTAPFVMDCIDCHNQPSHVFNSPDYEADLAILAGQLDQSMPDIKKVAVDALSRGYGSREEAMSGIADYIDAYYRKNYPDLYAKDAGRIEAAVATVRDAYAGSIFPSMKVEWSKYPNNIGHFLFPGCMRCHDGNHKDKDGRAIRNDCNTCHIIISQGSGVIPAGFSLQSGLEFRHPVDIGGAWKTGRCFECHSGTQP